MVYQKRETKNSILLAHSFACSLLSWTLLLFFYVVVIPYNLANIQPKNFLFAENLIVFIVLQYVFFFILNTTLEKLSSLIPRLIPRTFSRIILAHCHHLFLLQISKISSNIFNSSWSSWSSFLHLIFDIILSWSWKPTNLVFFIKSSNWQ